MAKLISLSMSIPSSSDRSFSSFLWTWLSLGVNVPVCLRMKVHIDCWRIHFFGCQPCTARSPYWFLTTPTPSALSTATWYRCKSSCGLDFIWQRCDFCSFYLRLVGYFGNWKLEGLPWPWLRCPHWFSWFSWAIYFLMKFVLPFCLIYR